MSWSTPKTDWLPADVITDTALNNIGNNLASLHLGGGQSSIVDVASAANLDISGYPDSVFTISGSTEVNCINASGREPGCIITLLNTIGGSPITLNSLSGTGSGGNKELALYSSGVSVNVTLYIGMAIRLLYSGSYWYAINQ